MAMLNRVDYARKIKDRIFSAVIGILVILAVIACLLPFVHILATSLSSERAVLSNEVTLYPVEFNLDGFRMVLLDRSMIHSLGFTIFLTVIYTAIGMVLTVSCAYPLTKKRLKGRNLFLTAIIITMYFSGGIIPEYILVKKLGILDRIWALILPVAINSFYVIILKTFFTTSIPDSIEEAANLDGCNDIRTLTSIVLPMSTPVLACISLFYAVGRWNAFQDALFYITNPKIYPIQLKLYQLVYNSMSLEVFQNEGGSLVRIPTENLKAACVVFSTIPILLVYPWLQRYFISGIMIGAIKE